MIRMGQTLEIDGTRVSAEEAAKACYDAIVRIALLDMQSGGMMCLDIEQILRDPRNSHLEHFFRECCLVFKDFFLMSRSHGVVVDVYALMEEKQDSVRFLVDEYVSGLEADAIEQPHRFAIQCI